VEVIHTNGNGALNLGMGIVGAIGHVDIFPNGGRKQPGCNDLLGTIVGSIIDLITLDFEGAISIWACSHTRGSYFYAESLRVARSCPYIAYQCQDDAQFQAGNCFSSCKEPGRCLPLGYNARNMSSGSGKYYMATGDGKDGSPYCLQSAQLQVQIGSGQLRTTGSFWIQFRSPGAVRSERIMLVDNADIGAGSMLSKWANIPSHILSDPATRSSLVLHYQRGGLLPGNQPRTLQIASINVLAVDSDFGSHTHSYDQITIDFATDTQIS